MTLLQSGAAIWRSLAFGVLRVVLAILIAGAAGGALVRFSSGFGADERVLDGRLTSESILRIRQSRQEGSNLLGFYGHFFSRLAHGDLGYSQTLDRPIAELLRERSPVTTREVLGGVAGAALIAALWIAINLSLKHRLFRFTAESGSAIALCLPVAILGYLCILLKIGPWVAIAVCTAPHLFRYLSNLVESAEEKGYVLAARARGVPSLRLCTAHILLPCVPEALALTGTIASIAFSAAVPVEFASGAPGIGQLAWQAATSRDLPLLCILTMIAAAVVVGSNSLANVIRTVSGAGNVYSGNAKS